MNVELITRQDLQAFRLELLNDLKGLIIPEQIDKKEWLRSSEVRKMLKISPGTLQNMRVNGKLAFTKIGGIFFYHRGNLKKLLESNIEMSITY